MPAPAAASQPRPTSPPALGASASDCRPERPLASCSIPPARWIASCSPRRLAPSPATACHAICPPVRVGVLRCRCLRPGLHAAGGYRRSGARCAGAAARCCSRAIDLLEQAADFPSGRPAPDHHRRLLRPSPNTPYASTCLPFTRWSSPPIYTQRTDLQSQSSSRQAAVEAEISLIDRFGLAIRFFRFQEAS